jgi:ubiquinone/menaquinone biosynthesis C-methylase UbiE
VTEFDELAENYDKTRGGEARGDSYAADIDALLPKSEGPILEIGVGTGVVALGLSRRGRDLIGLDLSSPMLARARSRLGGRLVRSDAMQMSIATAAIAHAVSVWVVHSVRDPVLLFREAARVLRPAGVYVVCLAQKPAPGDKIGRIISEMGTRVDERRRTERPRGVKIAEVLDWASEAGFVGTVHGFERHWVSAPSEELDAIALRQWPALRELDDDSIEEVTRPAVDELRSMPPGDYLRQAYAEVVVFERP